VNVLLIALLKVRAFKQTDSGIFDRKRCRAKNYIFFL